MYINRRLYSILFIYTCTCVYQEPSVKIPMFAHVSNDLLLPTMISHKGVQWCNFKWSYILDKLFIAYSSFIQRDLNVLIFCTRTSFLKLHSYLLRTVVHYNYNIRMQGLFEICSEFEL